MDDLGAARARHPHLSAV